MDRSERQRWKARGDPKKTETEKHKRSIDPPLSRVYRESYGAHDVREKKKSRLHK